MPGAGTTTTMTMIEGASLARLLAVASPFFPTGGFAYSHGVEWAVEAGDVHDIDSLTGWLRAILRHGAGRSDAILLRHAHRAAGEPCALAGLGELAGALSPSAERLLETASQGEAFGTAAGAWGCGQASFAYPVAFGAFAGRSLIGEDAACIGYLSTFVLNLISAAVRLVPLGQSDAVRAAAALQEDLLAVAEDTRLATLDDLGGACFRSDLAAMRHETQYSRMFRS
jgi:urease accessory protein